MFEVPFLKKREYGAIYVANGGKGMSGMEVYHNTFVTDQPVLGLVNIQGPNVGVAFRNNLLMTTGAPLVNLGPNSDAIRFQGDLYWIANGAFRTTGHKATGISKRGANSAWRC